MPYIRAQHEKANEMSEPLVEDLNIPHKDITLNV